MSAQPDLLRPLAGRSEMPRDPWRALVEQWPGAVVFFDGTGVPVWANPAAARLGPRDVASWFGLSPDALRAFEAALAGSGAAGPIELELPDAAGLPSRFGLRLLGLGGAGVERVAGLLEPLPAARPPATAAEERLETALDIARSGIWEMHVASGQVTYSDSYFRMLGVDVATGRAAQQFWLGRVHPVDVDAVRSAFEDYAHGRSQTFEYEYRMRHEDGRWLWLLDRSRTVSRDAQGLPQKVIGFALDITTRRTAEQALRDSEERFRLATEAVNGVLYESDVVAGTTVLHGVERLVGLREAEVPATIEGWLALVHPDDRDRVRTAIGSTRSRARSYDDLYYRVVRPDGKTMHVWARGSYICDASGCAIRAVGLIEDVTERVRAQEALSRSEFRFRAVANLAPGFVFEGVTKEDPDDCLVFTSDTFESLMGRDYEGFVAHGGWEAFLFPPSVAIWHRTLERMRKGEPVEVELHGRTARGRETWLRLQAVPVTEPATQRRTGSIGIVHDITEAKQAELALRESQLRLQTIIESSATNLALYDRDHRCIFANYTLHGGPVSDVIGRRIYEFIPAQDHEQVRTAFDAVLATGRGIDGENEMVLREGEAPRIFESRLRPVQSNGQIVGLVTNISDVTELRRQREDLRLQGRIIATIREGVVLLDDSGAVLLANPAMHALFGHAPDSLPGRNFQELTALPPQAFERLFRRVLQELDAGDAPQAEIEAVRADGERLVTTCIFAAIRIRSERRIVAVLSDITERKRLEREMLQVATREQQRIGSDLHDGLGQQLTGIALLLKGLVPRLSKARPTELRGDVEQIVALVNDAIDSTRGLARGLSPVPAADDGLPLALQALATQIFQLHGVEISVESALPEDLRLDDSIATHLYRIVQEALGNALRHGHPGRVVVQLRAEAGQIDLTITDDGAGFDRRAIRPSGLGLKIMRFRAQMIGGDLNVESTPGAGTTIRCHCPAPRAHLK